METWRLDYRLSCSDWSKPVDQYWHRSSEKETEQKSKWRTSHRCWSRILFYFSHFYRFCLIGFFLMMLIGVMYACCRQSKNRQTVSTTNSSGGGQHLGRTRQDGVGYSCHRGEVTLPPPYLFGPAPPVKPPPYSASDPPPPYSSVGDIPTVSGSAGIVNNSYVHQQ
ncbi:hypothetical protein Bbelb_062470 [Branchiostoma belcheri]|nr:hypothetical protein Bbelb_062470 [Branchiostoma belcheri]